MKKYHLFFLTNFCFLFFCLRNRPEHFFKRFSCKYITVSGFFKMYFCDNQQCDPISYYTVCIFNPLHSFNKHTNMS